MINYAAKECDRIREELRDGRYRMTELELYLLTLCEALVQEAQKREG